MRKKWLIATLRDNVKIYPLLIATKWCITLLLNFVFVLISWRDMVPFNLIRHYIFLNLFYSMESVFFNIYKQDVWKYIKNIC